jgi:hypothetical protein
MLHRMQQAEPNHMFFSVRGFPTKKNLIRNATKEKALLKQFMLSAVKVIILKLGNKKPVTTLVVKQASNSSSTMSKITKDICLDDSFVAVSKETSNGETSNDTSEASVTSTLDNSTSTVDDELHDKANANKSNNTTGVTMGGHPKGSTTANILDEKRRIELATHSAVQLLAETQSKKK